MEPNLSLTLPTSFRRTRRATKKLAPEQGLVEQSPEVVNGLELQTHCSSYQPVPNHDSGIATRTHEEKSLIRLPAKRKPVSPDSGAVPSPTTASALSALESSVIERNTCADNIDAQGSSPLGTCSVNAHPSALPIDGGLPLSPVDKFAAPLAVAPSTKRPRRASATPVSVSPTLSSSSIDSSHSFSQLPQPALVTQASVRASARLTAAASLSSSSSVAFAPAAVAPAPSATDEASALPSARGKAKQTKKAAAFAASSQQQQQQQHPTSISLSTSTSTSLDFSAATLAAPSVSPPINIVVPTLADLLPGTMASKPEFVQPSLYSAASAPRGLANLGNTCYMNCALQCLARTTPLRAYFSSGRFLRDVPPDLAHAFADAPAAALQRALENNEKHIQACAERKRLAQLAAATAAATAATATAACAGMAEGMDNDGKAKAKGEELSMSGDADVLAEQDLDQPPHQQSAMNDIHLGNSLKGMEAGSIAVGAGAVVTSGLGARGDSNSNQPPRSKRPQASSGPGNKGHTGKEHASKSKGKAQHGKSHKGGKGVPAAQQSKGVHVHSNAAPSQEIAQSRTAAAEGPNLSSDVVKGGELEPTEPLVLAAAKKGRSHHHKGGSGSLAAGPSASSTSSSTKGHFAVALGHALLQGICAAALDTTKQGSKAFEPRALRRELIARAPQFAGSGHHDAQEALAAILDLLHEDLNAVRDKVYFRDRPTGRPGEEITLARETWAQHVARNRSVIVDVFAGLLRSQLACLSCKNVVVSFDPFMQLSLPIEPPHAPTVAPSSILSLPSAFASFEDKNEGLAAMSSSSLSSVRARAGSGSRQLVADIASAAAAAAAKATAKATAALTLHRSAAAAASDAQATTEASSLSGGPAPALLSDATSPTDSAVPAIPTEPSSSTAIAVSSNSAPSSFSSPVTQDGATLATATALLSTNSEMIQVPFVPLDPAVAVKVVAIAANVAKHSVADVLAATGVIVGVPSSRLRLERIIHGKSEGVLPSTKPLGELVPHLYSRAYVAYEMPSCTRHHAVVEAVVRPLAFHLHVARCVEDGGPVRDAKPAGCAENKVLEETTVIVMDDLRATPPVCTEGDLSVAHVGDLHPQVSSTFDAEVRQAPVSEASIVAGEVSATPGAVAIKSCLLSFITCPREASSGLPLQSRLCAATATSAPTLSLASLSAANVCVASRSLSHYVRDLVVFVDLASENLPRLAMRLGRFLRALAVVVEHATTQSAVSSSSSSSSSSSLPLGVDVTAICEARGIDVPTWTIPASSSASVRSGGLLDCLFRADADSDLVDLPVSYHYRPGLSVDARPMPQSMWYHPTTASTMIGSGKCPQTSESEHSLRRFTLSTSSPASSAAAASSSLSMIEPSLPCLPCTKTVAASSYVSPAQVAPLPLPSPTTMNPSEPPLPHEVASLVDTTAASASSSASEAERLGASLQSAPAFTQTSASHSALPPLPVKSSSSSSTSSSSSMSLSSALRAVQQDPLLDVRGDHSLACLQALSLLVHSFCDVLRDAPVLVPLLVGSKMKSSQGTNILNCGYALLH